MEKNLNKIQEVLHKLIGLHRQLMDTVRLEREALANADLKSVQEATYAKEALIQAIRTAENERLKQMAEIAVSWKRPLRDLTISNLIIEVQADQPKLADQLRSAYNALTILIQRVTEQNDENRKLVEESLDHIKNMKRNVLGESVPKSDTYSAQGQRVTTTGGSRLISKEA